MKKRTKSLFHLLLLALFVQALLSSCAHKPDSSTEKNQSDSMTVDWTQIHHKPVPEIEKNKTSRDFGPLPLEEGQWQQAQEKSQKPSALILSPGLYRSLSYISLLKEWKLSGSIPHVIQGHGMSAVIAAYFAFGFEPDFIEWKFFKFINAVEDKKPFTKEWLLSVKDELLDKLKGKRIEGGKLTLIVPVYSPAKNKVLYLKRGDLVKALLANLDHKGVLSLTHRPAFPYEFLNKKTLKGLGVGKTIAIDILSDGISWKWATGFYNGIYEKGAFLVKSNQDKVDIFINYPLANFELDNVKIIAEMIFKSKQLAKEKFKLIKEDNI